MLSQSLVTHVRVSQNFKIIKIKKNQLDTHSDSIRTKPAQREFNMQSIFITDCKYGHYK